MSKIIKKISETERHIQFCSSMGYAEMVVHDVFEGVQVIYNAVHMSQCTIGVSKVGTFVEIQYCREGRIERKYDDIFYYLMPGDLSVCIRHSPPEKLNFPTRHYHGITVGIHIEKAKNCFSNFLEDINLSPLQIARDLCKEEPFFIIHGQKYVENIFSGLYDINDAQKPGYLKIKMIELMYILSGIKPEENIVPSHTISQTQVEVVRRVSDYLKENTDTEFSVLELAKKFHISQKHLQNAFKGVYGVSVFTYIRNLKMREAAEKIVQTNLSVSEIASYYGYDNPSKFSAAFQKIIGETPLNYRKAHRKL